MSYFRSGLWKHVVGQPSSEVDATVREIQQAQEQKVIEHREHIRSGEAKKEIEALETASQLAVREFDSHFWLMRDKFEKCFEDVNNQSTDLDRVCKEILRMVSDIGPELDGAAEEIRSKEKRLNKLRGDCLDLKNRVERIGLNCLDESSDLWRKSTELATYADEKLIAMADPGFKKLSDELKLCENVIKNAFLVTNNFGKGVST